MRTLVRPWALLFAAGALFCLELIPAAGSAIHEEKPAPGPSEPAALFDRHCAKCHGRDGRAKRFRGQVTGARNLTDPKWQDRVTDEQIAAAIKRGPGAMPSFEKKLSQAEIDALVGYVRHFKKAPKAQ
jgi:mono/diheme cytochrome c family protein